MNNKEKLGFFVTTEIVNVIVREGMIDWKVVVEEHISKIDDSIEQGREGVIESKFKFIAPTGQNTIVFSTNIKNGEAKVTVACLNSEKKNKEIRTILKK